MLSLVCYFCNLVFLKLSLMPPIPVLLIIGIVLILFSLMVCQEGGRLLKESEFYFSFSFFSLLLFSPFLHIKCLTLAYVKSLAQRIALVSTAINTSVYHSSTPSYSTSHTPPLSSASTPPPPTPL